jgi:hypothetical protein
MDFVELEDPFAMWLSSGSVSVEGTGDDDGTAGMRGDDPALGGIWGSNTEGGAGGETGEGRTVLPGSSIWDSMSGPIGSLGGGSAWARSGPLAGLEPSASDTGQDREERMDES